MARSGPCSPYVSASTLLEVPSVKAAVTASGASQIEANIIATDACTAASEVLYFRSGKAYSGVCGPVTIRPVARPVNETRLRYLGGAAWGTVAWSGLGIDSVLSHYGNSAPPEIRLPDYPVIEVTEVKIDGVVIPADEYELQGDARTLVRMRPLPDYEPTDRYGWPTSQVLDLPDTEPGTFSITYTFGQDPGAMGRLAAKKLAEFIALPAFGVTTSLPNRVTKVTRQGVSASTADAIDMLAKGSLGIMEVEIWLTSVNPHSNQQQATVWSPDRPSSRRQ